jgi:predicted SnoaL-like aldol condensation-catalyzing enzyme
MKMYFYLTVITFSVIGACSPSPDKATQECIEEQQKLEANKEMVAWFYQELFGNKNIAVIDSLIREDYIQHNPMAADGRQALKNVLGAWFTDAAKDTVDIQRIGADGDLVYLHTRARFGDKTFSVIDIFRIEDGKIAEHWDVLQEVPDSAANPHPMF